MTEESYTVKEDYYEELVDGGRKLIFRAGQVISAAAARDVGLVQAAAAAADALPFEPTHVPRRGR